MTEYPRWVYSEEGEARIVFSVEARSNLKGIWHDTPTIRDNALTRAKEEPEPAQTPIAATKAIKKKA